LSLFIFKLPCRHDAETGELLESDDATANRTNLVLWRTSPCAVMSLCRRDAETGELLEGDDAEVNLLEVLEEQQQQQGQEQQVRFEAPFGMQRCKSQIPCCHATVGWRWRSSSSSKARSSR
jgi:hypothetical protein